MSDLGFQPREEAPAPAAEVPQRLHTVVGVVARWETLKFRDWFYRASPLCKHSARAVRGSNSVARRDETSRQDCRMSP